jgi:flagellar basal body L-ring protein FlgH
MKVLTAILTLFVWSAAVAQEERKTCSKAESSITAYHKAAAEAQRVTKQAIRDWKENLDKKASAEFSSKGALALQNTMETQVSSDIERLKDCLTKIR